MNIIKQTKKGLALLAGCCLCLSFSLPALAASPAASGCDIYKGGSYPPQLFGVCSSYTATGCDTTTSTNCTTALEKFITLSGGFAPISVDGDQDGVLNTVDNCPGLQTSNITDTDGDGIGDACDAADCGNAVVEGPLSLPVGIEACDEGTANNTGVTCNPTCTLPACGDGYLNPLETCDVTVTTPVQPTNCRIAGTTDACTYCGDGTLNSAAGEVCDEGAANTNAPITGTSGCRVASGTTTECTLATCGDGIIDPGLNETCDGSVDCRPSGATEQCTSCGDGVVQASETCDYPGSIAGLTCNATCSGQTSQCGDGIKAGAEECDGTDGVTTGVNYCNASCALVAFCGDGIVNNGEQCDDGTNSGAPNYCRPGCLSPVCGDGIVDSLTEQCDNIGQNDGVTAVGGVICSSSCQVVVPPPSSLYVFTTSTTYNGNLGGLAGADAKCNAVAASATFGANKAAIIALGTAGKFKALLSTSTVNAKDRIQLGTPTTPITYKKPNGVTAMTLTGTFPSTITAALNITQNAFTFSGNDLVWTGTTTAGTATNKNCSGWTASGNFGDDSNKGEYGNHEVYTSQWIINNPGYSYCAGTFNLYCFQTP